MTVLLVAVHVFVCLFLIFIVLIQGGRGAELGAAFGGSSQTLFGGRGAATFLGKLTTWVAVLFMLTSLALTLVSVRSASVLQGAPAPVKQQAPAPPPGQ
jgi:preprotein translocase subunit SecG